MKTQNIVPFNLANVYAILLGKHTHNNVMLIHIIQKSVSRNQCVHVVVFYVPITYASGHRKVLTHPRKNK